MVPIDFPQPAMREERLVSRGANRAQRETKPRQNRAFRHVSETLTDAEKRTESHHREIKGESQRLWRLLDNPVYDSSSDPEALLSTEALATAKRGRRCAMETSPLGSNNTLRAIRDFERSAQRHGGENVQAERLLEYPLAMGRYPRILRRVRARSGKKRNRQRYEGFAAYVRKFVIWRILDSYVKYLIN